MSDVAMEPAPLSKREKLRLLEIAHETRDATIRAHALALLNNGEPCVVGDWRMDGMTTGADGAFRCTLKRGGHYVHGDGKTPWDARAQAILEAQRRDEAILPLYNRPVPSGPFDP
jgi:hypothetical protein